MPAWGTCPPGTLTVPPATFTWPARVACRPLPFAVLGAENTTSPPLDLPAAAADTSITAPLSKSSWPLRAYRATLPPSE